MQLKEWRGDRHVYEIKDFHHYREGLIPDSEKISRLERTVAETLIENRLGDRQRESSAVFELKHSSNVAQFARLLSTTYGLNPDVAAAGGLLHDIYVIIEGKYKNHAKLGIPIADSMMVDHGISGEATRSEVAKIVGNHSDKHIYSSDPLLEFGKDIDVLDCFLYPNAVQFYLLNKPITSTFHYLRRATRIWLSLGLPVPKEFRSLDLFEENWLEEVSIDAGVAACVAEVVGNTRTLPFLSMSTGGAKVSARFPKKMQKEMSALLHSAEDLHRWDQKSHLMTLRRNRASDKSLDLSLGSHAYHFWPWIGCYEELSKLDLATERNRILVEGTKT